MTIEFHETNMGRRFYESTMTGLANGVANVTTGLTLINGSFQELNRELKRLEALLDELRKGVEKQVDVLEEIEKKMEKGG